MTTPIFFKEPNKEMRYNNYKRDWEELFLEDFPFLGLDEFDPKEGHELWKKAMLRKILREHGIEEAEKQSKYAGIKLEDL